MDLAKKVRPKKTPRKKPTQYISPDGAARATASERQLNEAFAIVFRGAAADSVRLYLKSITTNRVMPPGSDPNLITYYEGARWLMGIIDTRIKDGEDKKP
jgi:hypothetical protein